MLALQLTAKHTKCAQNAQKRHFSAFLAVFLMCALCAIWHFPAFYGCFYAHSMSVHVYTRFLSSAGLPPDTLPLAVQRYDTKTILTNFCVKISQWNAFLGRRLRSLQGEAYANRAEGYAICVRSLLHVWPKEHIPPQTSTCLQPYMAAMWHADAWFLPKGHAKHKDRADMVYLPRTTAFPHTNSPTLRTSCTLFNKL